MKSKFLAIALFFATGCAKDTLVNSVHDDRKELSFSSYMAKPVIGGRAVETDITGLQGRGFRVYGHKSVSGSPSAAISDQFTGTFFTNAGANPDSLVVSYTNSIWTNDRAVYWPNDNSSVDFIAVGRNALSTFNPGVPGSNAPSFVFSQQTGPASMQDLIVAATVAATNTGGSVSLSFRHVLSRIAFTASIDDGDPAYNLSIEGIQINGVLLDGVYDMDGVNNDTKLYGSWTTTGLRAGNLSPGLIDTAVRNNPAKAVTNITVSTGALMIVPQATQEIQITYTLRHNTTIVGTQSQVVTIPVTLLGASWAPGTNYIYNIKVKPQASITFTPTVISWNDANDDIDIPQP